MRLFSPLFSSVAHEGTSFSLLFAPSKYQIVQHSTLSLAFPFFCCYPSTVRTDGPGSRGNVRAGGCDGERTQTPCYRTCPSARRTTVIGVNLHRLGYWGLRFVATTMAVISFVFVSFPVQARLVFGVRSCLFQLLALPSLSSRIAQHISSSRRLRVLDHVFETRLGCRRIARRCFRRQLRRHAR